jgi:TPR repeat protein
MGHDVFISYSSKDKTTGDAVCATLESEGIRCWIAPRDVTPSMEWSECIIDAIQECRIMVLVFTTSANDSPQIHREIERAVNHGVAVLPFRTEDILPDKALEYFIGDVHWLDALTVPLEAHLKNLAETVKMLLAKMPPVAPMMGASPNASRAEVQTTDPSLNRAAAEYSPSEPAKVATVNPVRTEIPQQRATAPPVQTKLLGVIAAGILIIVVAMYFVLRNPGTGKTQVGSVPANSAGAVAPIQSATASQTSAPATAPSTDGNTDWTTQTRDAVETAAKSGVPQAEYELGDRYYSGRDGGSEDNEQAFRWFRASADHGVAKAQNMIGNIYSEGRGVPQDSAQALSWYRKSAEQGLPEAQTSLGVMYDIGEGVAKNSEQADAWFRKAAEQGFAPGQYDLALAYEEGKGVPQNYQEASEWYRKSAEQDNVDACTNLGFLYENGKGVAKDYGQAMNWFRKAANHGNAMAQFNIGEMYEDGLGVPRDISQARDWYQKSADQGYANSVKKLASIKGK